MRRGAMTKEAAAEPAARGAEDMTYSDKKVLLELAFLKEHDACGKIEDAQEFDFIKSAEKKDEDKRGDQRTHRYDIVR